LHTLARNDPALATDIHDAEDVYNAVIARYLEDKPRRTEGVLGIPTGWPWLDNQTGGWQQGDIITLAARPGLGKTWLLLHMLYTAWVAGRSVMFFTTEMPPHQVGARLIGYQTGVNPRLLRTLQLSPWGERRLFQALETVQNDGTLKLVSAAGRSTQWVEDMIHEYQPDLVCIDGCYLLQPSSGRRDAGRFEKIGNVFDDINTMKLRTNKPILVTTQMNRAAGDGGKSGSLETLGYSDAIGTHSSIILQIKPWPAFAQCDIPGFRGSAARVIESLKGREGEIPSFPIFYEPPRNFRRIPRPHTFGDNYTPGAIIDREEVREGTREQREQQTRWMATGEQNG
jgi:replicative DNA helicase